LMFRHQQPRKATSKLDPRRVDYPAEQEQLAKK